MGAGGEFITGSYAKTPSAKNKASVPAAGNLKDEVVSTVPVYQTVLWRARKSNFSF
jgi:hypothetical protein